MSIPDHLLATWAGNAMQDGPTGAAFALALVEYEKARAMLEVAEAIDRGAKRIAEELADLCQRS